MHIGMCAQIHFKKLNVKLVSFLWQMKIYQLIPVSENKSQVEQLFPSLRQYFSVRPVITACGKNAFKSLELRGYTFLNTEVQPDKCFLLCATGETMFFCRALLLAFILSDNTYLEHRRKAQRNKKKKCHNQRILMFRLYTRGADSCAALCDYSEMHFHIFLLLVLPVNLALSSAALSVSLSTSVSSLFSFSHHLFSFLCLLVFFSSFFSPILPFCTKIIP